MAKKYQSSGTLFLWRFKKLSVAFGSFLRKHFFASIISISFCAVLVGVGFGLYSLFNSPRFKISTVEVVLDDNALQYKNTITQYLQKDFLSTNVVSSLWYRMKFLPYYKNKYQWIETIESNRIGNALYVNVYGRRPELYYTMNNSLFAQLGNTLKSVYALNDNFKPNTAYGTGSITGSFSIPKVELLISDNLTQSGFAIMFYGLSADALIKQIQIIHNSLQGYKDLQYIPGGQKLIVRMKNNKTLYFDLRKNAFEQLRKYDLVFGSGARVLSDVVDIGTMDDMIFMR